MNITFEQFQKLIPTNPEAKEWYEIVLPAFEKNQINTVNRIAGFMAQTAFESADYKSLTENMNYSWQRLREVFPRYFQTANIAKQFHRQPERIANRVYDDANRINKIGNTRLGDGWRFRGKGIKQLTGRWNFAAFGNSIGMTAEEAANYAETKKGALETAIWFWNTNNLARFADVDDIDGMSRAVNGGSNGLVERRNRYNNAKTLLRTSSKPTTNPVTPAVPSKPQSDEPIVGPIVDKIYDTITKGAEGDLVREVQKFLGISVDGDFGPNTEKAVKSWQRKNKFTSNGILNHQQLEAMLGKKND